MVGAQVLSTDLADGATATTLLGEDVTVTINDDGIFINDAQVTVADIVTDNGVVHVIDAVLLVPEPYTVVDVIVNSDVHNILEAAVIEADLAGALSGEGPFTVFAPTDDAFAALAEALNATAEDLLALPELADISFTTWWELRCSPQTLPTAPPPPPSSEKTWRSALNATDPSLSTMPKSPWPISSQTMAWFTSLTLCSCHRHQKTTAPMETAAGKAPVWDAELGQCVVDDDGCPQDVDGDFFISVGDVLSILVYFGHNCN